MMSEPAEAHEWHRIVRTAVRESLETWALQAEAGPVTVEALETILARATVPILRQLENRPPEMVVALLPSLVRTMLAAFVEVMAEQRGRSHRVMGPRKPAPRKPTRIAGEPEQAARAAMAHGEGRHPVVGRQGETHVDRLP